MLPQYEKHSSGYKDVNGIKINDLISWCVSDLGWNTFRVRIFVSPKQLNPKGKTDYAVCQDLAYVTALGKRIKDAGAYFMLDFHYSDTWVDALNIQAPAVWKGLSDELMADSLGQYTHRVLQTLKAAGATPDLVQVGNEIMYGLCGIQVSPDSRKESSVNWDGYLGLLKAGCNAVREECPNAQIIIHTDRPTNSGYNNFYYNKLTNNNVDFDIIGLSYYPFWHGYLNAAQVASKSDKNNLVNAIKNLKSNFPAKRVHIVECACNFQYWPSDAKYDTRDAWPCSVQGQYNFVKDLVDNLKPLENVDGINYWFPEDAGNGDYVIWSTPPQNIVEETWSNRGFWNEQSTTSGHAINKTGNVSGDKKAEDVCAPYYMRNFYWGTTDIETINLPSGTPCRKILKEGQLLILRSDGSLFGPDGSRR